MLEWLKKKRVKYAKRREANALKRRFFEIVKVSNPDVFIEVGAYDGSASLMVRKMLPNARVVAFEANPVNHSYFAARLRHDRQGVEYINAAVSDVSEPVAFRTQCKHTGRINKCGSILERCAKDDEISYEVEAVALDDFLVAGRPALWIDVEGATRQVLLGGKRALGSALTVLIEVEDDERWRDQWLSGDVERFMNECGLTRLDRDYEYGKQYNVLYVRA